MAKDTFYWGTGRRKSSVARVRIKEGKGDIKVNGRDLDEFFRRETDRRHVIEPLKHVSREGKYDVIAKATGGGTTGQAGAIVLGIARALLEVEPDLRPELRHGGYLTRDSRMVERKKYGLHGARRSTQYSKR